MTEPMQKVKATHQIVHDGQTLLPGTIFTASESLVKELSDAGAIDEVEDNEGKTVVELKPVAAELTPQAKLAADKKRLDDAAKMLDEHDDDDGLKGK